jgi:RNA polymerase sigma factor (TIGR02999 family)
VQSAHKLAQKVPELHFVVKLSIDNSCVFKSLTRKCGTAKLAAKSRSPPALWGGYKLVHRETSSPVTELLVRWRGGDRQALEALMPLVYEELRRLAHHYLRQERSDHTLQSTALVHEAYLRLAGQSPPQWQNRAHFFGIAAHIMRQILVEYARGRGAAKRGGDAVTLTLDEAEAVALPQPMDVDVVALDKALNELSGLDAQQGRIVELRFFAGLTIEDTSEVLGISPATVKRDWVTARAWLFRAMTGEARA